MTRNTAEQRFDEKKAELERRKGVDYIANAHDAINELIAWPVPGDQVVDTIGRVRVLEIKLAEYRRGLETETVSGDVGEQYRVTESRSARRTYNTDGLLAAFGGADEGLRKLMDCDAVRLTWRWSELQTAAQHYDVTLAIAKHEIEDGDPDTHVGEVWSIKTRVVAKEVE